ncbi:MAG: cytochrome c [Chloroflexi bacterium]|nr:cytochrome c [Chloroflexota bacterium]
MGIEVKSTRRAGLLWLLLPAVVGLVALACSTGAYPVDIFTEMHYQQSFKSQEPPRLYPPEGSVPFTDASLELRPREPTPAEALAMTSPFPYPSTTETLEHGKQIFIRNCSMCHGLEGRSDTFISVTFTSLDVTPPADFAIAPSITLTASDGAGDGLAFGVITNGLGNMPPFLNLLTYEDRWTVIHYLRFLSEQANQ